MSIFNPEQRQALCEAATTPRLIDVLGRVRRFNIQDVRVEAVPNAYVVYALLPGGDRLDIARYGFQTGKARAKRHAHLNAISTLQAVRRTVG